MAQSLAQFVDSVAGAMDCVSQQTAVILGVLSRKPCSAHAKYLKGPVASATDGGMGLWTISLPHVETGSWLGGHQVLISPFSVIDMNLGRFPGSTKRPTNPPLGNRLLQVGLLSSIARSPLSLATITRAVLISNGVFIWCRSTSSSGSPACLRRACRCTACAR